MYLSARGLNSRNLEKFSLLQQHCMCHVLVKICQFSITSYYILYSIETSMDSFTPTRRYIVCDKMSTMTRNGCIATIKCQLDFMTAIRLFQSFYLTLLFPSVPIYVFFYEQNMKQMRKACDIRQECSRTQTLCC